MITRGWAWVSRIVFFGFALLCFSSNLCFLLCKVIQTYELSYRMFESGDFLTRFWIINPLPLIVSSSGLLFSLIDNIKPENKRIHKKYRWILLRHLIGSVLLWFLSGILLVALTGGV